MVVVFELVPDGQHVHPAGVGDLEERNITLGAERNQQLAQEWALGGLAVDDRGAAEARSSTEEPVPGGMKSGLQLRVHLVGREGTPSAREVFACGQAPGEELVTAAPTLDGRPH